MMLARFLRDRKGSAAPFLALAALPLFGFIGAAIDFSRAASVRTSMSAALDSAALMLSKEAQDLQPAQLQQKANDYFQTLFKRPEAGNVQISQEFGTPAQGNFSLKLTGSTRASASSISRGGPGGKSPRAQADAGASFCWAPMQVA